MFFQRERTVPKMVKRALQKETPVRKKRFFTVLANLMMSGASLAASAFNQYQITRVQKQVDAVRLHMNEVTGTVNFLRKGFEILAEQSSQVTEIMHENLLATYQALHAVRCESYTRDSQLLERIAFVQYETTVRRHVGALMEGAMTGKITPDILSARRLRQTLQNHPVLKDAAIANHPSLVYDFGTLMPVHVDLVTLQFGFILTVPNPKFTDIVTTYVVRNTGFHMENTPGKLYRVPFPDFIAVTQKGQVTPFRQHLCRQVPGLQYCDLGAIDMGPHPSSCLSIFLQEEFANPASTLPSRQSYTENFMKRWKDLWTDCQTSVEVVAQPFSPSQVVETPAGMLIRSQNNSIKIYQQPPQLGRPSTVVIPKRSETSVYWIPHKVYQQILVDGILFTSSEQTAYSFVLGDQLLPQINFSRYQNLFAAVGSVSLETLRQRDVEIREYLKELPAPLILCRGNGTFI